MVKYTWVKRASAEQMQEMVDEVAGDNEIHQKENADDPNWGDWVYKLERTSDSWIEAVYSGGKRIDAGSFVRCSECGHVRALYEGQIEFCTTCWAEW